MPSDTKTTAIAFSIGLFFGLLVGVFVTYALLPDTEGTAPVRTAQTPSPHGAQAPQPARPPSTQPPATPPHAGTEDSAQEQFAKVHFMKKFVAALTETPLNSIPSPTWTTPLKDPSKPIGCTDCHSSGTLDFDRMRTLDPGSEAVERFRRRPGFMIPLMQNWVQRLNDLHGDRLRAPVTCTTCHAVNPMEKNDVFPPLMAAFVKALSETPANADPATGWQPLLKDPAAAGMLCGTCHGEVGKLMERNLDFASLVRPAKYADDKALMVHLMEEWVGELNRKAADLLVKAVVCTDCHERDPRR